jgi:hypothetical protein
VELHKMGLSCFPEFNQSITLSILCYLPPNLPPYDVGKLGNKTLCSFAEYFSRDSGNAFISPKDG